MPQGFDFTSFREATGKIGGQSALGSFVKNLTAMAQQVGLSNLKHQQELGLTKQRIGLEEESKLRMAGPLAEAEAQAKLKADPFAKMLGLGGETQQSGVSQQPTSLEDIAGRIPRGVTYTSPSGLKITGGQPLTPQQTSIEQLFEDAFVASKNIRTSFKKDPNQLLRTGLPFQPYAGELQTYLSNASDILLRLRSGAQINEREYDRLRGLLPRARDVVFQNPDLFNIKMAQFERGIKRVLERQRGRNFSSAFPNEDLLSGSESQVDELEDSFVED